MYKFYIFLIALVLSLFELAMWAFFGKSLDGNILILTCIMILPGLFTLLERAVREYQAIVGGRISKKIVRRKIFFFLLEKLESYAIIISCIASVYLGLFFLIGNTEALTKTALILIISIGFSAFMRLTIGIIDKS